MLSVTFGSVVFRSEDDLTKYPLGWPRSSNGEYVKAGFPNHKVWTFSPNTDEQLAALRELRAHTWIETMDRRTLTRPP